MNCKKHRQGCKPELHLSRKNRGSCTKDALALHESIFQFYYHMKDVTIGNEVRPGKSCWNDFVKKSKQVKIILLPSKSSHCFRKHLLYQYVQRNSCTETMKMEILEAQCLHRGFIISVTYIPKKSIQCVTVGERTSGWKGCILRKTTGWPTESIS